MANSRRNVLSFEHHRKLGCGGQSNKVRSGQDPTDSYTTFSQYGHVRVDVDFEEGEVVTHLNHHKSGNTKLARDVSSHNELEKILKNPRVHTGKGGRPVKVEIRSESSDEDDKENDQTPVSPVIITPFSGQFVQEVVEEVLRYWQHMLEEQTKLFQQILTSCSK